MRAVRSIEVDIYDFDEEGILEAARSIRGRESSSITHPLDDGPVTARERLTEIVSSLASAIVRGDAGEALHQLNELAGDDGGLRHAIELGRCRR